MQLSQARIEANRKNALKSTGPRTPEGKARSRGNAVTHGLSAQVVEVEDAEQVALATPAAPGLDGWLARQVALCSLRVDRCQKMERALRDRVMLRAELSWDDDRRLEAVLLGATLAKQPETVVARLRDTLQGCEWLIARWAMLAHAADTQTSWTVEQIQLAFDLSGTAPEFRPGNRPGTAIDGDGRPFEPCGSQAEVARRAIVELQGRRDALIPVDEAARLRALADLSDESDPELRRLRRHEATLQRRLQWALELLGVVADPDDGVQDRTNPSPAAAMAPAKADQPPATPSRAPSRADRRLLKAENRREARRRKRDERRN